MDAIKPSVVLATGDLTDAKTSDNMGSAQQIKEWEIYRDILLESEVVNKTVWLDIRGNHGKNNNKQSYCFGVDEILIKFLIFHLQIILIYQHQNQD